MFIDQIVITLIGDGTGEDRAADRISHVVLVDESLETYFNRIQINVFRFSFWLFSYPLFVDFRQLVFANECRIQSL